MQGQSFHIARERTTGTAARWVPLCSSAHHYLARDLLLSEPLFPEQEAGLLVTRKYLAMPALLLQRHTDYNSWIGGPAP